MDSPLYDAILMFSCEHAYACAQESNQLSYGNCSGVPTEGAAIIVLSEGTQILQPFPLLLFGFFSFLCVTLIQHQRSKVKSNGLGGGDTSTVGSKYKLDIEGGFSLLFINEDRGPETRMIDQQSHITQSKLIALV